MAIKKALVVDDSPTARHVLGRMLKQLGFAVLQAESGPVALTILRKESPHLVFLDHIMPEMDGFQVLKSLKSSVLTESIPATGAENGVAPREGPPTGARWMGEQENRHRMGQVLERLNLISNVKGSSEIRNEYVT